MSDTTQKEDIGQLRTDVAVVKNDISSIKDTQNKMLVKMDGFSFVKVSEFEEYKKYVEDTFLTKARVTGYIWFLRIAGATVITTIVGAAMAWLIGRLK